jgi:hypothetical protein
MGVKNKHLLIIRKEYNEEGPAMHLNVINGRLNLVLIWGANRMETILIEKDMAAAISTQLHEYLDD